jgi:hypothetical protein
MISFDLQGRTDRLETILQAIEQSQQTGIMNVQRGKGGVSEKGIVYFLYGEAVDAEVGERKSVEAWNWLKTWNSCQYVFTPKAPNEIPLPSLPAPKTTPANQKITSPLAFVAQILPKSVANTTTKSDSQDVHSDTSVTSDTSVQPVEPLPDKVVEQLPFTPVEPVQPPATPVYNTPSSLPAFSPPTYNPPSYNPVTPVPPTPQTYRVPTSYTPASRVPYRLLQGPEALAYIQRAKLTRQHRHIFFLLDGQRTVDDITRLTGHHITDILRMLADLERIGLIRQE